MLLAHFVEMFNAYSGGVRTGIALRDGKNSISVHL